MAEHKKKAVGPRLAEHPDERRMFDQSLAAFPETTVLGYIASALEIWHTQAPKGGSYREMLAIMANELRKIDVATQQGAADGR